MLYCRSPGQVLLEHLLADAVQFGAGQHREDLPPQVKGLLDAPVLPLTLGEELPLEPLAEAQEALVQLRQLLLADDRGEDC